MKSLARLALCLALAPLPLLAGCDIDNHDTQTGAPRGPLEPNKTGPGGSGSIADDKLNSGGPGAPGTTDRNPEAGKESANPERRHQ